MSSTTRRAALAAFAGVSALALPAAAMAAPSPSEAELVALGAALARCDVEKTTCPDGDEEGFQVLYDEHWTLRERINAIPATTIAGLRVKAQAAALALKWDNDAQCECAGAFLDLCKSINQDIIALASPART
jgi:hypothetical protein